jgi:L-amino acid N-acyltransferase YncA
MNDIKIRLAQESDAAALLAVYAPYIQNTSITFEYEVPSVEEFAGRIAKVTEKFPWLVCEIDGKTAGYVYAGLYHSRAAFQWDAELSIYLAPDYHRMGIASALYTCLQNILAKQGYLNLYALITVPNPQSIGFHEKDGFRPICVYRSTGFKLGEWHDMTVLEKQLVAPLPEHPQPCKTFREIDPAFFEAQLQEAEDRIRHSIRAKTASRHNGTADLH